MKPYTFAAIVISAVIAAPAGYAQQKMDDMKGMNTPKMASDQQVTHHASGVVKKADAKTGVVTIAHEAVPSMKWPAMTMDFVVQDKMMLDKFAVGQKVDFDFVKGPKGFVVTAVR